MEQIKYNLTADIFDIKRFAVNNGPGIRTVIYFKGCPLHCAWCNTPEALLNRPQVMWNRFKCVNCQHCRDVCSINAIDIKDDHISINHNLCDTCGQCIYECMNQALNIVGKQMTVKEVIDNVLIDKTIYSDDGGITLSGGEFLNQSEFVIELIKAAKEYDINVCCESSAYCPTEIFKNVISQVDSMVLEIKHYDNEKHIEKTSVSNVLPLANIKWALLNKENVLIRIPIIPDFNDTLDDARNFIPLLKELGVRKVQLKPFNQLGDYKHKALGGEYEYDKYSTINKEEALDYLNILKNGGIDAFI